MPKHEIFLVYNGYTQVSNGSNTPPLEISGFKLPDSGEVNAQFAAFAGEGEYIYGDGSEYDRMVMGRTLAQVTGNESRYYARCYRSK